MATRQNKLRIGRLDEKTCTECNVLKPASDFHARKDRQGQNLASKCKDCANGPKRNYVLIRKYGIGVKEYNEMFISQDGRCKICDKHQSELNRTLYIDHCHKTNKIRGLLCVMCNAALGQMEDSVDRLTKAIEYLENQ